MIATRRGNAAQDAPICCAMRVGPVAVALLVVVSAFVLLPNHPAGRDPAEDTGIFFYAAQRLLDGGAPYRDVWDHKPPGVYFVDAVGLALGGPTGVWVVQLAFLFVAVLLGYLCLRGELGGGPAFVGSLAWLVALPRLFLEYGQTSFVEFYALPLQFGALLLWTRPPTLARALAIGLLGGAAFLLKPTLVGIWLAIGLVVLVTRRRAAVATVATMTVGGLAPLIVVAAWAAARGILDDMVDQALVYNRAYSAYAPASERIDAVLSGLRLVLPSGLAVVSVAAWLYGVIARRWQSPLVLLALVALPIEVVLATFGRGYHYYFIAWLPAMAVLAAFAVHEVERRLAPGRTRLAIALAVLLMCVQPAVLVTRLAVTSTGGRFASAAAWVAANTRPDDAVFVWGSHTEILYLAGRRAPSRFVYQYAPLYTRGYATPELVDELLADLRARRPALILDASLESFVTPPLDRAALRSWVSPDAQYAPLPDLERVVAFIESTYERAGVEPATGWPVWRPRAP